MWVVIFLWWLLAGFWLTGWVSIPSVELVLGILALIIAVEMLWSQIKRSNP